MTPDAPDLARELGALERHWGEMLGISPVVLVLAPLPAPPRADGAGRHPHARLGPVLKGLLRLAGWRAVAWRDLFPSPVMWTPGEGIW